MDTPGSEAVITAKEFFELHSILSEIVKKLLGGVPPVPESVQESLARAESASGAEGEKPISEQDLRWVELLNLAVEPPMLRRSLKSRKTSEAAIQALIRFLVSKKPHLRGDREKVDWVVTYLFQVREERKGSPGGWFTSEIENILEGFDFLPLSMPGEEMLLEISALLDELKYFRKFSEITESRIIQRGRYLKGQFGAEFFHPTVLAAIVNYNFLLGRKIQALLQETVRKVSQFTPASSETFPDTQELLQRDYRAISDVFQQLTALDRKAELDEEQKKEMKKGAAEKKRGPEQEAGGATKAKPQSLEEQLIDLGIDPGRHAEQLRNRIKEIGMRIRSNPATTSLSYPAGALLLSDWEAKAFLTEYPATEESFRAEFARSVTSAIGIIARMDEELPAYFETKGAEHLWKRHCDALVYLLYEGRRQLEVLGELARSSEKRGLADKSKQLLSTAEKLEGYLGRVAGLF